MSTLKTAVEKAAEVRVVDLSLPGDDYRIFLAAAANSQGSPFGSLSGVIPEPLGGPTLAPDRAILAKYMEDRQNLLDTPNQGGAHFLKAEEDAAQAKYISDPTLENLKTYRDLASNREQRKRAGIHANMAIEHAKNNLTVKLLATGALDRLVGEASSVLSELIQKRYEIETAECKLHRLAFFPGAYLTGAVKAQSFLNRRLESIRLHKADAGELCRELLGVKP